MSYKRICNCIGFLIWSIITLIMLFFSYFLYNQKTLYEKEGKITSATIETIHEEESNNFIDYSFGVGDKIYYVKHHNINSGGRGNHRDIAFTWKKKKKGDTFEILYIKGNPEKHFILLEEDPRNIFLITVFILFAVFIIGGHIPLLFWNDIISKSYILLCLLITTVTISKEMINLSSAQPIIYFYGAIVFYIGMMLFLLIINNIKMLKRGVHTKAIITNCQEVTYNYGFRYNNLKYQYEYESLSGVKYNDFCIKTFFFSSTYAIGDIIYIIYDPDNPDNYIRLGITRAINKEELDEVAV